MCLGTVGTIAAISAISSAGAGIYSANKQAGAAKDASQQQQDAAARAQAQTAPLYNQALSIVQQQAQQGQARLDPYAQQGQQGLTALSKFLGVPQAPASTASPPAMVTATGTAPPALGGFGTPSPQRTAQIQQAMANVPTGSNGLPTGTTVVLRAPDGTTQAVPIGQAQFYLSRGATRV